MARELHLKVTRPSSLLSVVIDREISDTQLAAIEIVLDNDRMAYNVVEDDRITKLIGEFPRREGIEQYQAEDR